MIWVPPMFQELNQELAHVISLNSLAHTTSWRSSVSARLTNLPRPDRGLSKGKALNPVSVLFPHSYHPNHRSVLFYIGNTLNSTLWGLNQFLKRSKIHWAKIQVAFKKLSWPHPLTKAIPQITWPSQTLPTQVSRDPHSDWTDCLPGYQL